MAKKKVLTMELFEKYALNHAEPNVVRKACNLFFIRNALCVDSTSLTDLMMIPGVGRSTADLLLQVMCDLYGKK